MAVIDTRRPRFLSIGEAAAELNVSPRTIRRMVKSGRLPAVRLSGPTGRPRIEREALERAIEEGRG